VAASQQITSEIVPEVSEETTEQPVPNQTQVQSNVGTDTTGFIGPIVEHIPFILVRTG
jgi:hypothetical protein